MSIFFPRTKVAVIRGGASHGYEDSLKSGSQIISILREVPEDYEPLDIFISKEGEWHVGGLVGEPHKLVRQADVAWNTLHNTFSESGQVQKLLENLKVPFVGATAMPSLMAMNKEMSKRLYREESLLTPEHKVLGIEDFSDNALVEIFRNYMHPVVVKSLDGSFPGRKLVHSFHELRDAVSKAFEHSDKVLIEECVPGREAHCHVIEGARGEDLYALVPTGNLSVEENKQVEELARRAHRALGLRHYSSSNFVVTPKGNIYILGTNPLPHLHEDSHLHHSLEASGWKNRDFVDHCLKLALKDVS